MSRAWMPIWWGDYLRDTRDLTTLQHGAYLLLIAHYWQHEKLPTGDKQLAAIAGVSPATWKTIRGPIAEKFRPDWTHKRIDDELVKTAKKQLQWSQAGKKGGVASGLSRAVTRGEQIADDQAAQHRMAKRKRSGRLSDNEAKGRSENEAKGQTETKPPGTNHIRKITTFFPTAARPPGETSQEQNNPAGSLAPALPSGGLASGGLAAGALATSTLPTGALARPPDTARADTTPAAEGKPAGHQPAAEGEPESHKQKPSAAPKAAGPKPTEATRQDLEASFERKRARAATSGPSNSAPSNINPSNSDATNTDPSNTDATIPDLTIPSFLRRA